MEESLSLSYVETVDNITQEELLVKYEEALKKCNFRHMESKELEGKIHHKAIWGKKRDSERKRILTHDAIREDMQRFCAQATFEQKGPDVRFTLEVIPWMESEDRPEEFRVSQGAREKRFDEVYAHFRLEEILSAIPGLGMEPDDILYSSHYEDLPQKDKLKKLDQRYQDGKMSKEMYEKIKEWIKEGN